jgi:hypothetical protein
MPFCSSTAATLAMMPGCRMMFCAYMPQSPRPQPSPAVMTPFSTR